MLLNSLRSESKKPGCLLLDWAALVPLCVNTYISIPGPLVLVFNSYYTVSMLCFSVAPPSGISSIKAILVCPGHFHMALELLLSSPFCLLSLSSLSFPSPTQMKVPSADLGSAGSILFSAEKNIYESFKERFMRELFHKWDS